MDSTDFKMDGISWKSYLANREVIDEIISHLLIDDSDCASGTVAIIPKCVSCYFPNPDRWFITANNINDIIRDGTTLLWMAERMGEKIANH